MQGQWMSIVEMRWTGEETRKFGDKFVKYQEGIVTFCDVTRQTVQEMQ
jgi:hypothetical protein